MSALDRLIALSKERPLTELETARMSYMLQHYNRTEEQRARLNAKRRANYAMNAEQLRAAARERLKCDQEYAERLRASKRAAYHRRVSQ